MKTDHHQQQHLHTATPKIRSSETATDSVTCEQH